MGTLVCRVELNKVSGKGITVTVENKDGKITQTFVLDGTAITTTVKGEKDTSTITQKADSIALKCKTFTLEAETITCKSTKATEHKSDDTFKIESTKAMTIKSSDALSSEATKDYSIKSGTAAVKVEATTDVKVKGVNVALEGSAKLELKAAQLKLEGSAQAEMKGATVKVASDSMINLEGQLSNVKAGGVMNISGPMVKIG